MSIVPFDQRDGFIWLDGKFTPWKDSKIHVLNHGLNYASGVFDGERIYAKKIFKQKEHTKRLFDGAKSLEIDIPFSMEEFDQAKNKLIEINNLNFAYMKTLIFRGSGTMRVEAAGVAPHCMIAAWEIGEDFNKASQETGISLQISKWVRPPANSFPSEHKCTGGYVINSLSIQEARRNGFNDALLLDYRGYIAEGASSNFFAVKNNELFTPIADCFLNGITRQTILEIASKIGLKHQQVRMNPSEIASFDEVFVTGTAASILPVTRVESWEFKIGEITKKLISEYNKLTQA